MDLTNIAATLNQVYPYFGWVGSLTIVLGCVIAAAFYRGKDGEKYAIVNHFISELGEVGVSRLAAAFNTGMILGGLIFLPLMVGLGVSLNSVWGWLGASAGLVAAVSAVLVGVFSMDHLPPHRRAAITFFRSGLLAILLFTVAVFAQPAGHRVIPLAVNIVGILAILSYVSFLSIVGKKMDKNNNQNYILDPNAMPERPKFWRTAFLEWMIFFSTLAWFLLVSLLV
jgi:hypothetical membrane protein